MHKKNHVFLARSLDGFIADKDGGIAWLEMVPNPENLDMGYVNFMEKMDAIIMGRTTFEKVLSFGIDWPYTLPVFVVSHHLKEVPKGLKNQVEIISGSPQELLNIVHKKGYHSLYIDGGKTVQAFLQEDLIDEMTLTSIPILLGGGIPLFTDLSEEVKLEHISTEVFLNQLVQSNYRRIR